MLQLNRRKKRSICLGNMQISIPMERQKQHITYTMSSALTFYILHIMLVLLFFSGNLLINCLNRTCGGKHASINPDIWGRDLAFICSLNMQCRGVFRTLSGS